MTERGKCELCAEPVLSYQTAAFPVTGWEVERGQGGANAIKARKRVPNRIVHAHCLDARLGLGKSAPIPGQMSIEGSSG